MIVIPVTQSSSLSVEETTLVCVALSEPIYQYGHTDAFQVFQTRQETIIMLLVSVSHVTVHDNTSGHLQLVANSEA